MSGTQLKLTSEQQQAIERGEAIRIIAEPPGAPVVVLSSETFDRLTAATGSIESDNEANVSAAYPLVEEILKEDWINPLMAEYDDYERRKR